ncbi:MAG: vWA domain-containing protein [Candidatus Hodarchaeales archaeon]
MDNSLNLSSTTPHHNLIETILEYRLQQKLDTEKTIEFTEKALKSRNLDAVEILAESFPHVVADVLQMNHFDTNLVLGSSSLIFQIKDHLEPSIEKKLMQKLIPRMIRHSESFFHSIDRSRFPIRSQYIPGKRWNVEKTVMRFLTSGEASFNYSHVVCEERKERKAAVFLLIDKSHSVIQHLKFIIISAIIFSLALEKKDIGIISFDTQPLVIKSMKDRQSTSSEIVKKLIGLSSGGKTDIYSALVKARKELSTVITRKKTLVLISDLLATSGKDFLPILRNFDDVRIIITPRRQTLQLTKPLLGHLRRMNNVKLFLLPENERFILKMLEKVLYI